METALFMRAQKRKSILPIKRFADQKPLDTVTVVLPQVLQLAFVLNPFSKGTMPEFMGHGDDVAGDGGIGIGFQQAVDEELVDFQAINFLLVFRGQRGIARAKVIYGYMYPGAPQFLQDVVDIFMVVYKD